MKYKSYTHIEKLGNSETEGILNGRCSIQPKIDGSNGVLWLGDDGAIHAGSRKRELTLDNDNAGFYNAIINDEHIKKYLIEHPHDYLYGEWMVPHTIRYYNPEIWNRFYVFDVFNEERGYIPYDEYSGILDKYGITYIPEIECIENPTVYDLKRCMMETKYMIPEDKMTEGIVIKNYDFANRYGRLVYAKMVSEEFFGTKLQYRATKHKLKKQKLSEEEIAQKLLSETLICKEYARMLIEYPDASKEEKIGRLLSTVWHVFLYEEFIYYAEKKKPDVSFTKLKRAVDERVKEILKKELFV